MARAVHRLSRPTLGGILAMTAATAFVIFLASRGDLGLSTSSAGVVPPPARKAAAGTLGPVVLTAQELRRRASALKEPVYWVGPRQGSAYELSRATDGKISLRYVRPGSPPGAASSDAIVVGTYPSRHAYAQARQAVKDSPALLYRELPDGGLAVVDPGRPTSVYVAYPKRDYQIEVFDPVEGEAQRLVLGRRLERVR
jgi:hypothetical protein